MTQACGNSSTYPTILRWKRPQNVNKVSNVKTMKSKIIENVEKDIKTWKWWERHQNAKMLIKTSKREKCVKDIKTRKWWKTHKGHQNVINMKTTLNRHNNFNYTSTKLRIVRPIDIGMPTYYKMCIGLLFLPPLPLLTSYRTKGV